MTRPCEPFNGLCDRLVRSSVRLGPHSVQRHPEDTPYFAVIEVERFLKPKICGTQNQRKPLFVRKPAATVLCQGFVKRRLDVSRGIHRAEQSGRIPATAKESTAFAAQQIGMVGPSYGDHAVDGLGIRRDEPVARDQGRQQTI